MSEKTRIIGGMAVCIAGFFVLCVLARGGRAQDALDAKELEDFSAVQKTEEIDGNESSLTTEELMGRELTDEERIQALCDGRYVTNVEFRTMQISDVHGEYHFLFLSDMHILVINDEVSEEEREETGKRLRELGSNGNYSREIFNQIIENANQADLDGVLLGGDMLDFLSEANAAWLMDGLAALKVPYLYVTADHDRSVWRTDYSEEEQEQLRAKLNDRPVQFMDYGEFIILGVSDTTSQIKRTALDEIRKVFAMGKPVILMQHVPIDSEADTGFREHSRENWGDRVLLWGDDDSYQADDVTQEYLDLINAPDSPVTAVLAGHLHFQYEGMLNDHVKQYVFHPAYSGTVVYLKVIGAAAS